MNEPSPGNELHLAGLRRDYHQSALAREQMEADPLAQFARWLDEAVRADVLEPNAMALATVAADGTPAVRNVLLKECDARGFVFYTNYDSRKARHLAHDARAALLFTWLALERQVEVTGAVSRVSRAESEAYFQSRPRPSQLAAWASAQSTVLGDRAGLDHRVAELAAQFAGRPIPLPPHWGGYRLAPDRLEFWQGRPSRLHDRWCYTRRIDGTWTIDRLSP